MPNHVINRVSISGNKESIARCSEQIFKGGKFSFMNIKPMPEELNVEDGSASIATMNWMNADKHERVRIEKEYCERYGVSTKEARATFKRYADNVEKHGCLTWYDWRCKYWGTKWDAYEILQADSYENAIDLEFQTAWSTPLQAIATLAEQYPDLTIVVEFADEDLGCNCGAYGYCEGEYWEEVRDYYFACELWGEDPVELEECEEVEAP